MKKATSTTLMFADIDHDHPSKREEIFKWVDWFIGRNWRLMALV